MPEGLEDFSFSSSQRKAKNNKLCALCASNEVGGKKLNTDKGEFVK